MAPIYFKFIFNKLFLLFIFIFLSLNSGYFCLELLTFSSLPETKKLFLHFLSLVLFKADFFLNLSFLLATIHTLQSLKQHGELIGLQTGGIRKTSLSSPFFMLATILMLFSYWNTEFGVTKALTWKIKSSHKRKALESEPIFVNNLENGQKIIYQTDGIDVFDLYWIISKNEIIHCKTVSKNSNILTGHFVDKLELNLLGRFEKADSFISLPLPFLMQDIKQRFIPPEKCSLSMVYSILTTQSLTISTDKAKFITSFVYKIIHPWFPILFATGLLAFIIPTTRKNSYFAFAIGIFCFLLFYSIMKTFMILGENYLISSWFTVFLVPIGIQGGFTYLLCKK
jgi:lipopolysaccharide export LptBFGC system permease protein LptF